MNGKTLALGHIGAYSPVILILYLLSVYTVFNYERRQIKLFTEREPDAYPNLTLRVIILRYSVVALVVIVTAIWLPLMAQQIARIMHWQEHFVGALLVAFITTIPEIVVAVTAIRIQALDIAIGSILGSNLFNIAILAIEDFLYKPGPILSKVAPVHAISMIILSIMIGFVIIGLFYRPEQRILKMVGWISWSLLVLYSINSYFLFKYG